MLIRWITENLPYSELDFFPTYWAVNVSWHEMPKRSVANSATPKGKWVG